MIIFRMIGSILGIVSLILMAVAFAPLMGWLNWIFVPLAIISLIISSIVGSRTGQLTSVIAIIGGIMRLKLGGGIF